MTSPQPARKRSTFGDIDPIAPSTQPQPEPAPPRQRRSGAKTKVGFFLPEEEADRARAALVNTFGTNQEGPRTFSELIRRALLAEVERLERQYNNGEEWPPVSAGQVPTGRPKGESND